MFSSIKPLYWTIFDLYDRRTLIESQNAKFSKREQCELLNVSRSGLYYEPRKPTEEVLLLMRAIDEEYLQHPYYGKRWMTVAMRAQGFFVGQKRVRTAMQVMGLEAIYLKPNLSVANREHKKFPYLLRDLIINRPDQAWAGDIIYILLLDGDITTLPLQRSFNSCRKILTIVSCSCFLMI